MAQPVNTQQENKQKNQGQQRQQVRPTVGDNSGDQTHGSDDLEELLDENEQGVVEERSAISAPVVYGAVRKEGEKELDRPASALAWSGLAAGLSMGFSFVAQALLQAGLPDAPWRPLVANLGYSVGFVIVVMGRQQLFTENTLTPVLPWLSHRTSQTLGRLLRLWAIVLATNLAGALLFSMVAAYTKAFQPDVHNAFGEIGRLALESDFWTTMLKGVFAGWLIALMVWLLPAANTARLWVVILITYVVGLGGFSHIIAGSVETFYMAASGQASWGSVLAGYTLPTLVGNTVGGVALVAALNHAQVVSGSK